MARLNAADLDKKKLERKEQIMRAAIKVFAENGVKLTKISMIAKEAGISHGLVYHYFNSKEEVLYQSLEWTMNADETRTYLQQLDEKPISPLEKITEFTKFAILSSEFGTSDIFRIIQHLEDSEDVPNHVKTLTENAGVLYFEFFIPIFTEGQSVGQIIEGDPNELVALYLSLISGIMADEPNWWKDKLDYKVSILLRMISTR
ncbi:TetR/AcrR family transcriptional regulator [Alkalihalobacillus sp. 1P02AB]|uniref:TetR/AcrR family transcriptional regulator n=1 Tax=Alkalihalobacillus sp. 1P02AB TaxID=3132260 RepID=UPI0039A6A338